MKNFFFLPLLLLTTFATAQTTDRKEIRGEIMVPLGYEPEGIHIYNITSGYGTASDGEGLFEIPMATGDTLHFSAVQFEALEVVITQNIIDAGLLNVEIKEGLNELPEILIRSHDLTGNVQEDLDRIKTLQIPAFPSMQGFEELPVKKLSPRNAAINEIGGGANHLTLILKGIKLLFPKRKEKEEPPKTVWTTYDRVLLEKELRSRFDDQFFLDNFAIPVTEISSFVQYVAEMGFSDALLKKEKGMELVQLLMDLSEAYRGSSQR